MVPNASHDQSRILTLVFHQLFITNICHRLIIRKNPSVLATLNALRYQRVKTLLRQHTPLLRAMRHMLGVIWLQDSAEPMSSYKPTPLEKLQTSKLACSVWLDCINMLSFHEATAPTNPRPFKLRKPIVGTLFTSPAVRLMHAFAYSPRHRGFPPLLTSLAVFSRLLVFPRVDSLNSLIWPFSGLFLVSSFATLKRHMPLKIRFSFVFAVFALLHTFYLSF